MAIEQLLEREDTLEEVDGLLREVVRSGSGRLVLLEGVPGIGKTALLGAVRARAGETGATVLGASGAERETDLAYGVVRQLFAAVSAGGGAGLWDGAAALARPVIDTIPGSLPADGDPSSVMHGLLWLSAGLADGSGLVLTVDDAHWADSFSLRWVSYLARRTSELPIVIVVARRTVEDGASAGILASLAADPATVVLSLSALSEAGTAAFVRRAMGNDVPSEVCRSCHTATGGNPFYLGELLTEGGSTLTLDAGAALLPPASERVTNSVIGRLGELGTDAVALSRAAAVLGAQAALHAAARLAGLETDLAAATADRLAAASILLDERPLRFVHPIVRAAVYGELVGPQRDAMHRRAAEILHGDGVEATAIAVQLLGTDPHADPWVVARLRDGAEAAVGRGDAQAAAAYLARALREPPEEDERGGVLYELAVAERWLLVEESIDHLRAALALALQPLRRAELATKLTRALMLPGGLPEALAVAGRALPEAIDHAPVFAADLAAALVGMPLMHLASPSDPASAERLLERLDSGSMPALFLRGVLGATAMLRGRSAAAAWPSLEPLVTDPTAIASDADMVVLMANSAMLSEYLEESEQVFSVAIELAQRRGSEIAAGYFWSHRSIVFRALGKILEAEADARQGLAALAAVHPVTPVTALIDVLLERDDAAQALSLLRETGCDDDLPKILISLVCLAHRIRLRVRAGQLDRALHDLEVAERWAAGAGLLGSSVFLWRREGALACLAAGDLPRARSLADEQLRLARAFGTPGGIGAALRTAGIVRGGEDGRRLLAQAVEMLAPTPLALEHARALASLGAAQHRSGQVEEARATLSSALDVADRCGAVALANEARGELIATGSRPRRNRVRGRDALSASELRVATLAAAGATNVQIAQALFVVPKTVERHLTSAFAKLEVGSRGELAAALRVRD